MDQASKIDGRTQQDKWMRACDAFRAANGMHPEAILSDWNDEPERTHAEVIAAFSHAIEAERAKLAAEE